MSRAIIDSADWRRLREEILSREAVPSTLEQLSDRETLCRRISSDIAGIQPRASRLVCIRGFYWLRLWLENRDAESRVQGDIPTSSEDVFDRLYTIGPQSRTINPS